VHLTDTVVDARIEENALGRRRLAGVDVSHDADVAAFLKRYCACHDDPLLFADEPRWFKVLSCKF
jgi:hypothetical protein